MKQELPLAVVLLAVGCLLWWVQSESSNLDDESPMPVHNEQEIAGNRSELENVHFAEEDRAQQSSGWEVDSPGQRSDVVLASYQSDDENQNSESVHNLGEAQDVDSTSESPQTVAQSYLHGLDQTKPSPKDFALTKRLLIKVAEDLNDSKPFGANLELTGNLFGSSVSANGQYYQMGQGSDKVRVELQFGQADGAPTTIQLCDGRFAYDIQTNGDEHEFEFVDVQRVSTAAKSKGTSEFGLVTTGGISTLLKQIANSFQLKQTNPESTETQLRGSWDADQLRRLLPRLEFDSGAIPWSELPGQLPHAVEVVLTDSEVGTFPSEVRYYQFELDERDKTKLQTKLIMSMRFESPVVVEGLEDKYFVIDSRNLESTEATEQYIARMEVIRVQAKQQTKVAADNDPANERAGR